MRWVFLCIKECQSLLAIHLLSDVNLSWVVQWSMTISVNFVVLGSFSSGFWFSHDVGEVLSGIFCWNLNIEIFCVAFLIAGAGIYVLPVPVVRMPILRTSFAVNTGTFFACGLVVIEGRVLSEVWSCGGDDFAVLLVLIRGDTAVKNMSIWCVWAGVVTVVFFVFIGRCEYSVHCVRSCWCFWKGNIPCIR